MKRIVLAFLLATPAYAQTYDATIIPAEISGSPSTMTPLSLGDDNTRRVDLGFDFTYWDQTFSSAWISSNGFVSFGTSSHLCCNGAPIEQAPRNTIYGFWTDLISGGNPYYRRGQGSFLVGWYATKEYGTSNFETFEIGLFDDGRIQFNYGSLGLAYHSASAGITGPTDADNIQLFYGQDPANLRYQSGVLSWSPPKVAIDCTVTPLDPSCPPQSVAPIQVISSPTINTIQDAYREEVAADVSEMVSSSVAEITQDITIVDTVVQTDSITQQVAEVEATIAETSPTETVAAERLTPDQVAALAATSVATDTFSVSFSGFTVMQSASSQSSSSAAVESVTTTSSPSSASNTLEALNMTAAVPAITQSTSEQQSSTMSDGQANTMEAMSSSPAFATYSKVALQDRPDFYAIRDIYKHRRLRDANFEMYRMTKTNESRWLEMVDEQYRP